MVQGPLPAQPADAGAAQRSIKPPVHVGPEPESAETARSELQVTATAATVYAGPVARAQGIRADLVRAEAMLQVAQGSFAAIGTMYAGMLELAQSALDRRLTDGDRAALDASFQSLRQQIGDMVKAAVFDGEPLLGGGGGPDGEYVIALSAPRGFDGRLRFLVPAFAVSERLEAFREADLLTLDAARIATVGARTAVRIVRFHEDVIELQRAGLQQIYAVEFGRQSGIPGPVPTPEDRTRSISESVRDGDAAPFRQNAARLRDILELAHNGASRPRVADDPTPDAVNDPRSMSRRRTPLHDDLQVSVGLRGETGSANTDPAARAVSGDNRSEMASVPAVRSPPAATPAAVLSVQEHARRTETTQTQPLIPSQHHRAVGHKAGIVGLPGTVPLERTGPDLRADPSGEPFAAAILDLGRPENRAASEVRQTELPKIAELDMARRASGLVHQVRDADLRADAGLAIARTVYETPADQLQEFGAAVPVEPGAFMAELVRADNVLLVADLAIEQIDLHLDYLAGLAGESAIGASRDRAALDEIFQAVKANIIDGLAQAAEVRGEKILSGGGPDGAYHIHLSDGGGAGEGHDIAIPSMRLVDLSSDLHAADIRTPDAAVAALDFIAQASADAARTRDMIADERGLIQRLLSMEIARKGARSPLARSALGL